MKSSLNKASGQNYKLIFPKLPFSSDLEDSSILTLNIHSTVLPSISMTSTQMDWMGAVREIITPPVEFEPWYTQFIVDADFKNWYLLYTWMMLINNNKDHYDQNPRDYCVDAELSIIDNFQNPVMKVNIIDMFPTMLGEITLSHREGETNLESSVNFNYIRYEVDYFKND